MYKNVLIVELAFQVISAIISRSEIVGFVFFFLVVGGEGTASAKCLLPHPLSFILYNFESS